MSTPSKSRLPTAAVAIAAAVVAVVAIGATLVLKAGGERAPAQQVLRIGDQKGQFRALMEASGVLEGAPYKIEWSDMPAAGPVLEALSAGALDVGVSGAPPFYFAYSNGAEIRAIMLSRYSRTGPDAGKGIAILVPAGSPLKSIQDLRGKKLATVKGSIGHDTTLRLLDKAGIPFDAVQFVYLNNGDAKAALTSGAVDAWATWAPYVGIAVIESKDRILIDATSLLADGEGADVAFWSASNKALATKKPLLRDFITRYLRARAWAVTHTDEIAIRRSKDTGIPLASARYGAGVGSVSELSGVDDRVVAQSRAVFERYKRAGVIKTIPDFAEGGYDPSFSDLFVAANPKPAPKAEP